MTVKTSATALGAAFARRFQRDEKGNVAIIFGLTLLPMLLFMGAAIDYTRASAEHTKLQSAVDSAALALTKEPRNTPLATLQAKGQQLFAANFTPEGGGAAPPISVAVDRVNKTVTVSSQANMPTSFMALAGQDTVTVGATSVASYGTKNIELALVLDNTGSMAQNGKIQALRAAVNSLLTALEAKSQAPGDVKVSLVPFTTQVKLNPVSYRAAPWLRWDQTLENPFLSAADRAPPTPANWTGCLSDRDQQYDSLSDPTASGVNNHVSQYPAAKCQNDGLLPMALLTQDLETVRATANQMRPLNSTNITVGFVNGMSTLRSDHPLGANSVTNNKTLTFLVLLTDGNNTANRFGGAGWDFNPYVPQIDARLQAACQQAQTEGAVRVFTIRVMDGNVPLLKSCAVNGGKYFDVRNASQMQEVFDEILRAITDVRISS